MDELRSRPAVTRPVTMECAGNGRALMPPRAESQPWLDGAVGNAEWTGTPLPPLLEEAGLRPEAVELVFTGADHGIQGDVEQDYQWGFSLDDIVRDDVLLVYEMNGQPLPPQHGYPVRLLVPDWYGMCSVKWLRRITAVDEPFDGFQLVAYRLRQDPDEPGMPVKRKAVRAMMVPPGFSDFPARQRFLDAGPCHLVGRAWSGSGHVTRVEVSVDGGGTWSDAELGPEPASSSAWRGWSYDWSAEAGEHELLVRATDEAGNGQPMEPSWNYGGFMNNTVQRVPVLVR
jgi:DMSO/TMAO reductase YedYZ molybdopterin-dependent catalytic subunit